jgi:hypothetical protein
MSSAQNPEADREDYVVSVLEFSGERGAATAALQRVFGLSEVDARAILSEVPVAVRRDVNRIRAEYFRRALELSGARVEVRNGAGEVVSAATAPRGQPSGPLSPRAQPSAPVDVAAAASQPTAAGPVSQRHLGKTLALGAPAANDATRPSSGGWGDLEPFKPTAAKPAPAKREPLAPATKPEAAPAPPAPEDEWALSLDAAPGPLDSPLTATTPHADRALELASEPSPARAAKKPASVEEPNALELEDQSVPDGPTLELDVEQPRVPERVSTPRYDAISAAEHRRAPGSETLAKARRKQAVQSQGSGFGDPRSAEPVSATRPRVGPRPPSGDLHLKASIPDERRKPAEPRINPSAARASRPLGSPPLMAPHSGSRLELGVWEAMILGLSGTSVSWIAKIAGASVVLAGLAQLSVRVPPLGLPLFLAGLTCVLGLCSEYHRYVFWAAATREDALRERPALSVAMMMRDGVHLTAFALLSQVLLWFWLAGQLHDAHRPLAIVFSPTLWVLGFGPGFYWPIALACAAARNRASGVWDFGLGFRALGRAPADVAVVVLVTAAAFMLSLMLAAAIVSATSLDPTLALFTAGGLPIAISHALAAALMGRAVHARPDLFE